MAIERFYKDVTAVKVAETVDGIGGTVNTYTETTIKALINQASANEIDYANKLQIEATHNMYYPIDIDLTYVDKVIKDGRTYQVVGQPLNTVGRNHHYRVLLKELVNG